MSRRLGEFGLTQTWDANHRLHTQAVTDQRRLVQRRAYTYRGDGAVTNIVDQLAGVRRFDLDTLGRVTGVQGPDHREEYAYDPSGNISYATGPLPMPGSRSHEGTLIRRAGGTRYTHDAQGRMTGRVSRTSSGRVRAWQYRWNSEDRLVSATTPDGATWRYFYDALGRRIAKVGPRERVDFTWDGTTLAEQMKSDGHTTTWDYQPGEFTPVTQTERVQAASQEWIDQQFYAIVTDLVGTPMELVDAAGELAWRQVTTVWGTPLTPARQRAYCPLRFPGQYHDVETGQNYNYHRYYDPESGGYQSGDPLGVAGGLRAHSYVLNPLNWVDPLGLVGDCPERKLKENEIYIYRAVKESELHDIHSNRGFSNPPGIESKYFSYTAEGAAAYGREAYRNWPDEGPYTIVRTIINKDLIPSDAVLPHVADVRGGLGGVALPTSVLPQLGRPRILPHSPLAR
ncbi:RHS repeat-associated core domain-containing protein [Lentzea xinjiangensis]|uniref:RHS repeat-associated core domain-containing protein n=1 Tax=Lentzea xinjiangensis TaxID=402600 RepID=A0A1H9J6K8_9PSEU|nr:RHS repeat-associated core domain-containing protein [Lentzea xinjiangensis]SEQ82397.1 RHS repeat-associated core domain-containing protein [Lentzea xinjiangensis]